MLLQFINYLKVCEIKAYGFLMSILWKMKVERKTLSNLSLWLIKNSVFSYKPYATLY